MIIKTLKFKNFRNFKNEQKIDFCTDDGKLNIIYGLNGEGKTTLHQLFQRLFYGKVYFTKASNNSIIYNFETAKETQESRTLEVSAFADFEHDKTHYNITRTHLFEKKHGKIQFLNEVLVLTYKDNNNIWQKIYDDPQGVVNEMLPEIFSKYFFFDGERMVDDLKGNTSSGNLEKAIYYLFNLQSYDDAIRDLGSKQTPSSVLGKLESELSVIEQKNQEILDVQQRLIGAQNKCASIEKSIKDIKSDLDEYDRVIEELSEKIGSRQGSSVLENLRANYLDQRKDAEKNSKKIRSEFGNTIFDNFPYLVGSFTSPVVNYDIDSYFNNSNDYIPGITRPLIEFLIKNDRCICNRPLTDEERKILKHYDEILPPKSFEALYLEFVEKCKEVRMQPDILRDQIDSVYEEYTKYRKKIYDCENKINEVDDKLKSLGNIDFYVDERKRYQAMKQSKSQTFSNLTSTLAVQVKFVNQYSEKLNRLIKDNPSAEKKEKKKILANSILSYLIECLTQSVNGCRSNLQNNIQELVDEILHSKREISIDFNFDLHVTNSYGDDYKNEGTFAVVSFAYILGLLRTLEIYNSDSINKKYALILDAPFSKLDDSHKSKVISKLKEYGKQIIIFSKDNISDFVDQNFVGNVFILESDRADQTVTNIKSACANDVDYYFSNEHIKEIELRKKGSE